MADFLAWEGRDPEVGKDCSAPAALHPALCPRLCQGLGRGHILLQTPLGPAVNARMNPPAGARRVVLLYAVGGIAPEACVPSTRMRAESEHWPKGLVTLMLYWPKSASSPSRTTNATTSGSSKT